MLFILGLILFITIKVYSNCRKTDESIFQLYTEILQLRAYMRMKDKLENDKIWMDDLEK